MIQQGWRGGGGGGDKAAGVQNYSQLKQTNKTSYASQVWDGGDGGYKWVKALGVAK